MSATPWSTIKARRAALRAAGICIYRMKCGKPARPGCGGMCRECRDLAATAEKLKAQRRSQTNIRRARLARGACVERANCMAPIFRAGRCEAHWHERREHCRENFRETYYARKAAGLCVYRGCQKDARADGVTCEEHAAQAKERARSLTGAKLKRRNAQMKRSHDRIVREREEAGVCRFCDKPVATRQLCAEHRDKQRAYNKAHRKRKRPDLVYRCAHCGEQGHYRTSCPNLNRDVVSLGIVDIATRGMGVWT